MGIISKDRGELNATFRMAMEQARLCPNKERALEKLAAWAYKELRPDRRVRNDKEFQDKVRHLWRWRGFKAPTIARELGVGKTSVYAALRAMGIVPDRVHRAPRDGEGRPRKRTGLNWRSKLG